MLGRVAERSPLEWARERGPEESTVSFLILLAYVLVALPALHALLRRTRGEPSPLGPMLLLSITLVLALSLGQWALSLYVDALWFRELGAEHRFWTEMYARWGLTLAGIVVSFGLLWLSAWMARGRRAGGAMPLRPHPPHGPEGGWPGEVEIIGGGRATPVPGAPRLARLLDRMFVAILALLAWALGNVLGSNWWTFLTAWHQQPFGKVDPQFHRDIAFYVFTLPAWNALLQWGFAVVLACIATSGALYVLPAVVSGLTQGAWLGHLRRGARHLSVLVGLLLALWANSVWISRYELVYSGRGPLVGVSAVDANLGATLMLVFAATLLLAGLAVAVVGPRGGRWFAAGVAGLVVASAVLELAVIPSVYDAVAIRPEQLRAELPYILRHLAMTRQAFGLDSTRVRVREFPEPRNLTAEQVAGDSTTIANLRLADWRPLQHTFNQLQTLRTYYRFADIDLDRYTVRGQPRMVMISLRELDHTKVPQSQGSEGWDINRWFIYTHGYGACVSSVNSFTAEGIPELWVRDLPPVSTVPELRITRPEIYFGELTTHPVMVRARGQQEFDYPRGDDNIFATYQGTAGIPLGGVISVRRLAFALRYGSLKFFLSSYIAADTRILFDRDIETRLGKLAPFLTPDRDPYAVVRADGSLILMRDFYTTTDQYPYAAEVAGIRYVRNSVKAVLDCYNGSVRFYVEDDTDPLVRTYRSIFPDLFTAASQVPRDVRAHYRYPEDMLAIQAEAYGAFHVKDPVTFYNHEDVWETGAQSAEGGEAGTTVPVLPYYMLMRLPGQASAEYLQMMPLTPRGKDNMIAWVAGLCDPAHYGTMVAYHLPKGTISYGPRQIEARIDQDANISKDLTLWNQQGSQVLRGNLLAVPIDRSFLYVEPLYIQSTGGKIPELKRVIVATQKDIGYGGSLEEALTNLFGPSVGALAPQAQGEAARAVPVPEAAARTGGPRQAVSNGANPALVHSAAEHLRRYQQLMGAGKASEAGAELEALARDLRELERASGGR
ncbi:MAG TPA: UPF0182 family protein [Candidatus Saccharimonadales bacterium]|nr:UPF0182 family protein [Candidatus Saccharimonadales bacterium]